MQSTHGSRIKVGDASTRDVTKLGLIHSTMSELMRSETDLENVRLISAQTTRFSNIVQMNDLNECTEVLSAFFIPVQAVLCLAKRHTTQLESLVSQSTHSHRFFSEAAHSYFDYKE